MTIRKSVSRWFPWAALLGLALGAAALLAQDAAEVSPKVVKVKLDNDRVRVLEVISHPGDKEGVHSHPATVVFVVSGGKLRLSFADGTKRDVELATGDTAFREPVTHSAENVGSTDVHQIIVELKKP
jgi:mannose-6-phosphate isomerase-like protein (cupin superfamily)